MDISITDSASGENELRTYSGDFSIFPNIGGNYHMRKSFFVFDTVIGFNMKFHLPRSYSTVEATTNDDLWQDTSKADSFKQTFRTELTYYFGIQSDY
jgi:hypothetical protein